MKRIGLSILTIIIALSCLAAPAKKTSNKTTKKKNTIERLDKGSWFQGAIGGGVSNLQYDLKGGQAHLFPSLNLHFGYTYYFNKYVGINTGLQYTTYATRAEITDPIIWYGLTDYMGDAYNHIERFDNWQERQSIHSLEIPLALALKFKPKKVGLFINLGAKLGFAVDQHYKNTTGTITHSAYYPIWNVTMQNLDRRYETEDYTGTSQALTRLRRLNAIGYAEIGTLIELNPHTDLTIAAYADIYLNNAAKYQQADQTDLGFATRINEYGSFMPTYQGVIGTTLTGTVVRPWAAGLKIGISITPQRTDKEKEKKAKKLYKEYKKYLPEQECKPDTVFIKVPDSTLNKRVTDTIYLYDTVAIPCIDCALKLLQEQQTTGPTNKQQIAQATQPAPQQDTIVPIVVSAETKKQSAQLDSMLRGAVIWFHFDEYVPILQPAYILDSVADMLLKNAELRVHVNGHACSIGSDSYNQRLAQRRAQAVANLLKQKGVKANQMIVQSFGATEPFRYNDTEKHKLATDRRVEIIPEIYGKNIKVANPNTEGVTGLYTKFIGEETIKEGTSLAQLARKWYGHTEYWVYIYEANSDKITNPSNLTVGLTIMIPDLKASIADSSEKEMLRRAKQLEKAYKK